MGLHFSEEEFKSRKSKVLNSMKKQNIDALLMFRQESMYWLTGYDTFGYVFFQTLILDKNLNKICGFTDHVHWSNQEVLGYLTKLRGGPVIKYDEPKIDSDIVNK